MALKLLTNYKGYDAEYWRIDKKEEYAVDTTVYLGLYKDETTRRESFDNLIFRIPLKVDGVDLLKADIYTVVKTQIIDGYDFTQAEDILEDTEEQLNKQAENLQKSLDEINEKLTNFPIGIKETDEGIK